MEKGESMLMKEWYQKNVRQSKMCTQCTQVVHFHEQTCPKCTCSIFFHLTRLISPEFIARIIAERDDLRTDPVPDVELESGKLGVQIFDMREREKKQL
jgi:hypothetical protein